MKSIVVKDIQVQESNFEKRLAQLGKAENKDLKSSLEHINYLKSGIDGKSLLPCNSKFRVDFVLENASTGFANGIRKCIIDEIPIYSFTMDGDKMETSDRYILSDYLKKNIELIPINQDISPAKFKTWKISLDLINSTDEVINIKSGDIEIMEGKKKIPIESVMSKNISIMELHPSKFIKIQDITVVQGVSKDDAAKFACVSNTRYEILDMIPLAHDPEEKERGLSSMMHDPKKFKIGYTTYRNVKNPNVIIYRCCDTLTERLNNFEKELKNVSEDKKTKVITHFSTHIDVETRGKFKFFNFKGESWNMVNIISQYCFMLDSHIPFVAPSIIHPSTDVGVIKIKHANSIKIIEDAIKTVKKDLAILKDSF
jgi:DNA-directed RNA polymerase subunit L